MKLLAFAFFACSTTCSIKYFPVSRSNGFPGNRTDPYRAGITIAAFIPSPVGGVLTSNPS